MPALTTEEARGLCSRETVKVLCPEFPGKDKFVWVRGLMGDEFDRLGRESGRPTNGRIQPSQVAMAALGLCADEDGREPLFPPNDGRRIVGGWPAVLVCRIAIAVDELSVEADEDEAEDGSAEGNVESTSEPGMP